MGDERSDTMRRIAVELDRLGQEVSATQHVLDDAEPNSREELVLMVIAVGLVLAVLLAPYIISLTLER
jgi:hypothetical protein